MHLHLGDLEQHAFTSFSSPGGRVYIVLQSSAISTFKVALNGEMAPFPARESLFTFLHDGSSWSELSYMFVPKPPLAYTCYVPTQCVVPQPPEVYYQPPPQAYAYQPAPVGYVYQPPPVTYFYQPPAQYYYYQPPTYRVQ